MKGLGLGLGASKTPPQSTKAGQRHWPGKVTAAIVRLRMRELNLEYACPATRLICGVNKLAYQDSLQKL